MRGILLAAAWLTACAPSSFVQAKSEDAAFKVPRAQIIEHIKTVGVMPLNIDPSIPNAEAAALRYEDQIVARLEHAGFVVVKPAVMREIRERIKKSLGGFYDPIDGKANQEKLKAYEDYTKNEYQTQHHVDGTLWLAIKVRGVRISGNEAEWDGVSEWTNSRSLSGLLQPVSGQTPALSLLVYLENDKDEPQYAKAGGIQVLGYIETGWFGTKLRDVDSKYVLTDSDRDLRAIAIALDPLVGDKGPQPAKKIERPPMYAPPAGYADALRPEEFIKRYNRIFVVPVELPSFAEHDAVQQRYGELLRARLTGLGFKIVEDPQYAERWKSEQAAAAGFFDPFTGKLDKSKQEKSRIAALGPLLSQGGIDAVVYPGVVGAPAPFAQGEASWDGAHQRAFDKQSGIGGWLDRSRQVMSTLAALSLQVQILDTSRVEIYKEKGGIQLLERLVDGQRTEFTEAEWFTNASRDENAVTLALRGLAPPPPPTKPK